MHCTRSEQEIAILAFGSTGDVLPFIALACGMSSEGYKVRLITHARFQSLAQRWKVDTAAVELDPYASLQGERGRAWLDSGNDPLAFAVRLRRMLDPLLDDLALQALNHCQNSAALIASGLACLVAPHVAEKLRITCIPAYLQPMTSTTRFRNPFVPNLFRDGSVWNWLTHFVYQCGSWAFFRSSVDRLRRETLGLGPQRWSVPFSPMGLQTPVLYGYSPSVLPKPDDWSERIHVTGYWFQPLATDWQPSPDFADFLDSGPPPVCIGFGSMTDHDPEEMTNIVLAALKRAKRRGVLLTGWGALSNSSLPDDVRTLDSAPHEWLLPRTCAVVHHGGAGSTAAGLRAGVPVITVPFFGDQFFWGGVVHRIGAGTRPISRRLLTVGALATAIAQAVNDRGMAKRAQSISEHIRREDGVRSAVLAAQRHLGWPSRRREAL